MDETARSITNTDSHLPTKSINIALIVKKFGIGGMERCIARIANNLDSSRFNIHIICIDKSGLAAKWIDRDHIPIIELGYSRGNNIRLVRQLASTLRDLHIDVAHSHNWATLLETVVACRLAGGIKHLHAERGTIMGPKSTWKWRNQLRSRVFAMAIRRADRCMTNAYSIVEKIQKISGLQNLDISVIPNGLDCPYTEAEMLEFRGLIRKSLRIDNNQIVIGSAGRLHPVKNFEMAIESFSETHRRHPKTSFLLVGDGSEHQSICELVSRLNINDAVHVVGSQRDVWPFLAAMDIFVNTSKSEGMSQSLLEAMAAGNAVVVTDVGDSRRVTETIPVNGRVIAPNDSHALADELSKLVEEQSLLSELSHNSRKKHRTYYELDAMVRSFDSLYHSMMHDQPEAIST